MAAVCLVCIEANRWRRSAAACSRFENFGTETRRCTARWPLWHAALSDNEILYTDVIPHLCLRLLSYSRFFTKLLLIVINSQLQSFQISNKSLINGTDKRTDVMQSWKVAVICCAMRKKNDFQKQTNIEKNYASAGVMHSTIRVEWAEGHFGLGLM